MSFTTEELREMLAAAERADVERAAADDAASRVERAVSDAVAPLAALVAAASASGLVAPDLAAIVAAAIERAAPAAPDALAAIIAPDAAPVVVNDDPRRTRRRVERDWSRVTSGSIWTGTLAGITGRVKIVLGGPTGPTFIATTGARGTYASPSRALQAATGNPRGAGRRGEATCNGFVELTIDAGTRLDGSTIIVTLDTATRPA